MSDHVHVPPKREVRRFGKHTVTVTFTPSKPEGQKWHWSLRYVHESIFVGFSKSLDAAFKDAQKKIDEHEGRNDQRGSK